LYNLAENIMDSTSQAENNEKWQGRCIAHVDMDCFFVAVERLKDPSLIGKPVVVGGDPDGRGVVSSASYEAREFGVHSAMPAATAKKKCPDAIFLRGGFDDYQKYSRAVRGILEQYTPMVEMASIDEAYLDLTGTERLYGNPLEAVDMIKNHILEETGLVASFGVGTNKLIAKIASDYGKPDGITIISFGMEADFLAPMNIRELPGIGPSSEKKLHRLGIRTIGQLAGYSLEKLSRRLDDQTRAEGLHRRALGESDSPVVPERQRKSISKETTFREDISDLEYLESTLHYLTGQVVSKLRTSGKTARTVTIKYRYADFETHTRALTLDRSTDSSEVVYTNAQKMMNESVDILRGIRLIGVGVTQLQEDGEQLGLFQQRNSGSPGSEQRAQVIDELRKKYGYRSVMSGQSVNLLKNKKTS